jgi:leucyl/phenylalanyl-tRNA--protein transferase
MPRLRQKNIRTVNPGVKIIPARLLVQAYGQGLFPMALRGREIGWFSPDPRGVLPVEGFRVPHGLARALRRSPFEIRVNTAFRRVIEECAVREETWIDEIILESYVNLHRIGFAHSVEAWAGGELAGGLYGVALGGAFFGESMFHRKTNASKVALHALVERLRGRGFALLDTQWLTPHLAQFGAVEIPRVEYLRQLARALAADCSFV